MNNTRLLTVQQQCNPSYKITSKTTLFDTVTRKLWSQESKAFSISMVTKYTPIFCFLQISVMSEISRPLLLMHRLLTSAVCIEEIIVGRVSFSFAARDFDIVFVSPLSSDLDLQF